MNDINQVPLITRHAVSGRFRFYSPLLYRAFAKAEPLEQSLRELGDVHSCTVNARIGSLLITCDADISIDEIRARVSRLVLTVTAQPHEGRTRAAEPSHISVEKRASDAISKLGAAFTRWRRQGEQASAPISSSSEVALAEPWHAMTIEQVGQELELDFHRGLEDAAVAKQRKRFGVNALPAPRERSSLAILIEQFTSVPVALLAGSAVLSAATGGLMDAAAIVAVVVANAVIGYVTESGAERTIRSLERIDPEPIQVRRGGRLLQLEPDQLVVGDTLVLRPATMIPADCRLLNCRNLSIDESTLTGESVPVEKRADEVPHEEAPLADRLNMVYRGTFVTGGEAEALVVATGARTELGKVQTMLGSVERRVTPLEGQLSRLGIQLVVGSSLVCGGVFLIGLARGQSFVQMLKTAVSLAVAAVPEGLPTVAVTTLALGIRRMDALNVSVRHMGAVETLGAIETLCLDKTGTITENRMVVQAIALDNQLIDIAEGRPVETTDELWLSLQWLYRIGYLCSEVTFEQGPEGLELHGSPTETALVQAALDAQIDVLGERRSYPLAAVRHRSETEQLMRTLHDETDSDRRLWAVKGRPSEVLAQCSHALLGGHRVPLDHDTRSQVETHNERMAGRALRVLGFAYVEFEGAGEDEPDSLTWCGLIGLADPPRPGTYELLQRFHQAGIATLMITGDQSGTAQAVAKQIGLTRGEGVEILDSVELEKLDPDVLRPLALRAEVFARVSPAHKLRIVQALQSAGKTVAMTGDGINDSPALKAADVGVAMGANGAAVARDVADVVLKDDRLESMIAAVEHGRTIYDDIKKAVRFVLATNLSEILLTATQVAIGRGETLTPMQLLWINILTDIFPELALAVQPPEDDVLARPPHPSGQPMFTRQDMKKVAREGASITLAALAAQAWVTRRYGFGPESKTVAFMTLTSAQLLHAISARSERHSIFSPGRLTSNPYISLSVGGALGLQIVAGLFPPLRQVLGNTRIRPADWLVTSICAVTPLLINEFIKVARPPTGGALTEGTPHHKGKALSQHDAR